MIARTSPVIDFKLLSISLNRGLVDLCWEFGKKMELSDGLIGKWIRDFGTIDFLDAAKSTLQYGPSTTITFMAATLAGKHKLITTDELDEILKEDDDG